MDHFTLLRRRCAARNLAVRGLAALGLAALTGPLLLASGAAQAQSGAAPGAWTASKPVRMVVPYAPGGGADVVARIVSQALGGNLGAPIIVDNKPGASGSVGTEFVSREAPDGHTIEMSSVDTHSIFPHVNPKARFNAGEFTSLAPVVKISFVLMGRPGLPAKTVADVLKLAQQKPLTYATWGVGTTSHVAMAMFRSAAKLPPMTNVPYRGAGPAAQALMGSEVDLMMMPTPLAVSYRSKLVVLGIASAERSDALQGVPTLGEQGVNIDTSAWIALVGPPKMPSHIADAIYAKVTAAVNDPEVQKRFKEQAMTPHHTSNRAQFDRYLKDEYRRWGETVREANITLDE